MTREDGRAALDVIVRDFFNHSTTPVFFDLSGVKVLAPSFCDELFGTLQETYVGRVVLDETMGKALRAAFDTVAETRNIQFQYAPKQG